MPAPVVSPWLFNAHAFAAPMGLPHLRAGNHLRISHHPYLGLPDAPFIVWRAQTETMKGIAERVDAVWTDTRGRITPPFTLTPDNPVTARLVLNPGETCLWAEIVADPESQPLGGEEFPVQRVRGTIFPTSYLSVTPKLSDVGIANPVYDRLSDGFVGSWSGGIRVEAYITSPRGPAFAAARAEPPFAFAAPGIVELRMRGSGTVMGIRWLEAASIERLAFRPWRALNLPHEGGPRYIAPIDAIAIAEDRVREAAPLRRPLQETLGVASPVAAPPHTPNEELRRVLSLSDPIGIDLDVLITDLSTDERFLTSEEVLRDGDGNDIGRVTVGRLNRVLQATLDPGVAEYLGYMTVDKDFVETEHHFVFYLVDGYFRHRPRSLKELIAASDGVRAFEGLAARLPVGTRFLDPSGMIEQIADDFGGLGKQFLNEDGLKEYGEKGPFLRLGCLAVADRSAPPLPPPTPVIEAHRHVGWLPAVPPAAHREVRLDLAQGLVGGLLAAEKFKLPNGSPQSLNPVNPDNYHLPLSLSLETDDTGEARDPEPGQGFLCDRQAADATTRYSVAQQDRFGRWSDWVRVDNPPGPRPRPPRPVFQALYRMPAIAEPMPAGDVQIIVHVPDLDALAPGGLLLQRFRLEVEDRTTLVTSTHLEAIADPGAPPDELQFTIPAPLLSATEVRRLRLVAQWEDVAGTLSAESEPVIVTMHDPRPPAQLSVPDTLMYAARPDVQGRALVEFRWTSLPGQDKVAVYYTDENRLLAFLNDEAPLNTAAQAVLDELAVADDAAARATVFRASPELFKSYLFERLDVVPEALAGGEMRFQHYVSGSLRILSFYRLSAETAAGARVVLETLPLIIFGVPNSEPPAKPILAVRPDPDTISGYAALAEVRVVQGVTQPVRLRLRRSVQSGSNPANMPVVGEAAMGSTVEDGFLTGHLVDTGPVRIAPAATLKPWVRYFWSAEVQGDPEPGSTVAGCWSPPSDPVSLVFTPPGPPAAVITARAVGTLVAPDVFEDVQLEFDHPDTLNGGEFGSYRLRVYRLRPGEPQQMLAEHPLAGDGPFSVSGMDVSDPADRVPTGTVWRLVLLDPLGRASPPLAIDSVVTV
jgi:hypothetical protein